MWTRRTFPRSKAYDRTNEYLKYVKMAGEEFAEGKILKETRQELDTLLFDRETFETMADASWGVERKTGEKLDDSLIFTKQMAALYNKDSYQGKEIVLEMCYTDVEKTYQIVLGKEGFQVLTENLKTYTTRIETPYTVWKDIASGKISGQEAMMQHLYKVKGDFDLMLHWDNYFGATKKATEKSDKEITTIQKEVGKTNMSLVLLTWIVFWVAVSIQSFWGGFISIIACGLTYLLFLKNKKTIYDVVSNLLVSTYAALLLIFDKVEILLPLSYLTFGLMWTISCFTKIPLTAHYSANDYNGDAALQNPLFIKTNRILTLMWGVLYIITAIMAYYLMQTNLRTYLGILCNISPIFMGIFTGWFQKWYPAKVARG